VKNLSMWWIAKRSFKGENEWLVVGPQVCVYIHKSFFALGVGY
jgi:hypothetical protein